MVSNEVPSYNSSRVQRAFRINSIEQARLSGKLQLLEKEKVHAIRVTNQDIRLISLTLDYIQACSGRSEEGESLNPLEAKNNTDEDPCFLYGERIVSRRRARRFRRPESVASSSRASSETGSQPPRPRARRLLRPQSTPLTQTNNQKLGTESLSGRSSPSQASTEMSTLTRKLLQAQQGEDRRSSVFTTGYRQQPERSQSAMSRVLRTEATLATLPASNKRGGTSGSRKSSFSSHRGVGISEILNKASIHVMSAQAWSTHLKHKKGSPLTYAEQREDLFHMKKEINDERNSQTQEKVRKFVSQNSTR